MVKYSLNADMLHSHRKPLIWRLYTREQRP
jgi:hypothetical protein